MAEAYWTYMSQRGMEPEMESIPLFLFHVKVMTVARGFDRKGVYTDEKSGFNYL